MLEKFGGFDYLLLCLFICVGGRLRGNGPEAFQDLSA
jgi:hypothetical protein